MDLWIVLRDLATFPIVMFLGLVLAAALLAFVAVELIAILLGFWLAVDDLLGRFDGRGRLFD